MLKGTSIILKDKILKVESEEHFMMTLDGKWTILENIGNLIDLEQIWLERIRDILDNKEKMRSAYLKKRKFQSAKRTLTVIEIVHMVRKDQLISNRKSMFNSFYSLAA